MATQSLAEMLAPQFKELGENPALSELNDFLRELKDDPNVSELVNAHGKNIHLFSFGHKKLYADAKHGLAVEWINGDQTDRSYNPVESAAGILVYGNPHKSVLVYRAAMLTDKHPGQIRSDILEAFGRAEVFLEGRLRDYKRIYREISKKF